MLLPFASFCRCFLLLLLFFLCNFFELVWLFLLRLLLLVSLGWFEIARAKTTLQEAPVRRARARARGTFTFYSQFWLFYKTVL